MTDRAEQILRVVGLTLGVVGIVLAWQDGTDTIAVSAVGKLVLVFGTVFLLLYVLFRSVGDTSDST